MTINDIDLSSYGATLLSKAMAPTTGLIQENYLQTATDELIIKEINDVDQDFLEVYGKLSLEALHGRRFGTYESIERPISLILTDILFDTGWTYSLIDPITKSRTIRQENASVHEILLDAAKTYAVELEFDTLTKTVKVYQTRGLDRGAYVYSDLNLKASELQGDTYDFVTRLFPYGKDGLTVAAVNDGKDYIENFQHAGKIVERIWVDERYTNAQALFDDATLILSQLSTPRVSFSVEVLNLLGSNPVYNALDFRLVHKNASVLLDQTEYQRQHDAYCQAFEILKARKEEINNRIGQQKLKRSRIQAYLNALARQEHLLTEFDAELFLTTADAIIIGADGLAIVRFQDESTINCCLHQCIALPLNSFVKRDRKDRAAFDQLGLLLRNYILASMWRMCCASSWPRIPISMQCTTSCPNIYIFSPFQNTYI